MPFTFVTCMYLTYYLPFLSTAYSTTPNYK